MAITPPDRSSALFADSGIKLGLFGVNVNAAGALSRLPSRHEIDWGQNVALVQQAEKAGFEAAIPFSRWRGFEGDTNPWGRSYESYTWAAALAALTSKITLFATSHSLTVSPVMAAKQIATIDHVSSGRIGLNVVAGWFEKELRMFSAQQLDHDERYAYAEEWLYVVTELWQRNGVDHRGQFLTVEDGYMEPKPVQDPRPPIMNAAFSPRGHRFAAEYADIAFVSAFNAESAGKQAAGIRSQAAEFGREVQVWVATSVVCADTDAEAAGLIEHYQTHQADQPAVENAINWTMGAGMGGEQRQALGAALASTMAGYPLVGSADTIASEIGTLAEVGIDGICQTFMNYEEGLPRFVDEVLPILERDGISRARGATVTTESFSADETGVFA